MKRPALLLVLLVSCAETPAAPPKDDGRYWLGVCAAHGYTQVETAMATGREAPEVARLWPSVRPPARPPGSLLLLPYPYPYLYPKSPEDQRVTRCSDSGDGEIAIHPMDAESRALLPEILFVECAHTLALRLFRADPGSTAVPQVSLTPAP